MTALIALGPLALTPLIVWLLIAFGPERGVILAVDWLVPSIVFAIAFPILRRRGVSLRRASMFATAWAIVVTIVVFIGLIFAFKPATAAVPAVVEQADTVVRTPPAGSAARTVILDAVRKRARVKSKFKVGHIRATDRWAFVRCVEVVNDGEQLQETDLDIAALLERKGPPGAPRWEVVDFWSLSTDDEKPYAGFARRVRERARDTRLPSALFPDGFLTSDVPVE